MHAKIFSIFTILNLFCQNVVRNYTKVVVYLLSSKICKCAVHFALINSHTIYTATSKHNCWL